MRTIMPEPAAVGRTDASAVVDIFTEGDELYDAMCASIAAARHSVALETYIFAYDGAGHAFVGALKAKAREGVSVRLHVDAFGSLFVFPRVIQRELEAAGVQVRRFHHWQWRNPWRYNRRNHRKLLVIDGELAYLGGFNIHKQSSRRHYGVERWRDTHLRLRGELARQAQVLFDMFWRGPRKVQPFKLPANQVLLSTHSRRARRQLRKVVDDVLESARETLWLTTPYFVPNNRIQNRLIEAAQRGIDVRVLVPGKNDVRLARWASHAAYAKLLAGGVRIFEYRPRVLHSKTAVVDCRWAMVGTSNLDYRSIFLNYEVDLFSQQPSLCRALHDQFLADLGESDEIFPDKWSVRPWAHYPLEAIGWAARRWL